MNEQVEQDREAAEKLALWVRPKYVRDTFIPEAIAVITAAREAGAAAEREAWRETIAQAIEALDGLDGREGDYDSYEEPAKYGMASAITEAIGILRARNGAQSSPEGQGGGS